MRNQLMISILIAVTTLCAAACSSSGTIPSNAAPKGGAPTSGAAPHAGGAGQADGTWKSDTVTLVITGSKAELKAPHDCPGDYSRGGGLLMLTCSDGNHDRETGSATLSGDGKTLTISWDDGMNDTLTRG